MPKLRKPTALPAASAPVELVYSRAQETRGNLSLWAFATAVTLYWIWLWLFRYPPTATVNLFGFERLQVSHCGFGIGLVTGWLLLTGIYSIENLQRAIANAHRPFRLLTGKESKDFYSAIPTALLAGLLLLFVVVLGLSNVALIIKTDSKEYEALIEVHDADRQLLIVGDPESGDARITSRARLSHEEPVRLVLRGFASPALIVRDRYDLVTQDAWRVRRRGLSFDFEIDMLELWETEISALDSDEKRVRAEKTPDPKVLVGVFPPRRSTLVIEAPLRLNRPVLLRVLDLDQQVHGVTGNERWWFKPGIKQRCFTTVARDAAFQAFLDEICERPEALASWMNRGPTEHLEAANTPFEDLPKHRLEILSVDSGLYEGSKLVTTRPDVVRITAYQRP